MRGLIALEDGSIFHGRALAAHPGGGGEVVFNTSMTGYQEILTDPSYHAQIVLFTAPHVGNYGIHPHEGESKSIQAAGLVAREVCAVPSHPGSVLTLGEYLRENGRFGLTEVDTRALTLLLRQKGNLRAWLTTDVDNPQEAVRRARAVPEMRQVKAVPAVSSTTSYEWPEGELRRNGESPDRSRGPLVAVLDCGVKRNILRELTARGCRVTVLPHDVKPEELERLSPDGLVLSNGPGDPEALLDWLPRIRQLVASHPTLAVCLGHQLAGLLFGARIIRLPFGHHGGNHPVKDLLTGRVLITSQNHNYALDGASLPPEIELTHVNLNDGTVEGFRHRTLPLWSLQFHPEAAPGPHDAAAEFDHFVTSLTKEAG